jgi:hypothetical protein
LGLCLQELSDGGIDAPNLVVGAQHVLWSLSHARHVIASLAPPSPLSSLPPLARSLPPISSQSSALLRSRQGLRADLAAQQPEAYHGHGTDHVTVPELYLVPALHAEGGGEVSVAQLCQRHLPPIAARDFVSHDVLVTAFVTVLVGVGHGPGHCAGHGPAHDVGSCKRWGASGFGVGDFGAGRALDAFGLFGFRV